MSFTGKLDKFKHDLVISDGKFTRSTGAEEVRQRVKVALWHYIQEYFINLPNGVPWYEEILGSKGGSSKISNILRTKILRVPGVVRIVSFEVTHLNRNYTVSTQIIVESGPGDLDKDYVVIDGLVIPVN